MQIAAFVLSLVALLASLATAGRQMRLSRHSNSIPVLVDLFREHRSERLAHARLVVYSGLDEFDLGKGMQALPEYEQKLVRDLAWFYDNLGALVLHGVIDIKPIAGYLGGSIINAWEKLAPLVEAERRRRLEAGSADPGRWQEYFEYLYNHTRNRAPQSFRDRQLRLSLKAPLLVRIRGKIGKLQASLRGTSVSGVGE